MVLVGKGLTLYMAPDQFVVARPLAPEYLDRCVTRHGIYSAFPAPMRVHGVNM